MLDDGERLVPGFRQARALRVWAGVRPLFQDEKAGPARPTRATSAAPTRARPRASATASDGFLTISGGKLTTYRLMAAGPVDAMCRQLGDERPCTTADDRAARLGGRRVHVARLTSARARGDAAGRAADLRVRAHRAQPARGDHARARQHEPRRHPPQPAAGHGPVPGRLLHLPRRPGSCTASAGSTARRPPTSLRGFLAGALEGLLADPLRRPAAPGAPRRLDLPGPAGRGARAVSGRLPATSSWSASGMAGLTAAIRLAESGARVLVLAKGVGATHLSPCTIDVLGYAPERVERPARGAGAASARATPTIPTLGARRGRRPRVDWFKARPCPATRAASTRTCCCRQRSARCGRRRSCRETMAGGDMRRRAARCCVVGFRALKDFHARLLADNLTRRDRRPRGRAGPRSRRARRRQLARLRARVRRRRASARSVAAARARRRRASGSRSPRCSASRTRTGRGRTCRSGSGARCSRCRRCRRRCRACASSPTLREALRRAGGKVILNAVVVGAEPRRRAA